MSEVAWEWKPPRSVNQEEIREFGEGVLVLLSDGVVALSGETGDQLWAYRDRGQEFVVEVSDSGEHVTLNNRAEGKVTVLDSATGQVVDAYDIDLDEIDYTHVFGPNSMLYALRGITGEAWIVRWEDSVSSYDLSTGEPLWSVQNVPGCPDVAQVDGLVVQADVVVAATTCFEHPGDRETVAWTVGHEFVSELVGLSPDTGEELWRVEHSIGDMPYDSLERTISPRPGGFVHIDFNDRLLGESFLDIEAGEATHLDTDRLIWTSSDGSQLGLWDTESGEYRIQDRAGDVDRTLERDEVSMRSDMVTRGHRVGLEGGVLYLEDQMEDGSVPKGFARFEGFDGSSVLTWDKEESLSVSNAISVPGGVAVAFIADDQRGVMGLR